MKKLNLLILTTSLIPLLSCYAKNQGAPYLASTPVVPKQANILVPNKNPKQIKIRFGLGRVSNEPYWNSTGRNETLPTYRHFTKFKKESYLREYIQRKTDKKAIMFYKHERGIYFTLGHQNQLVLINDAFASKGNIVVVSDLKNHCSYPIDKKAGNDYLNRFPNGTGINDGFINAVALGFSPDDKQVLIYIDLENQSPLSKNWGRLIQAPVEIYTQSLDAGKTGIKPIQIGHMYWIRKMGIS